MNLLPRLASHVWILTLLLGLGFVAWTQQRRMQRVEFISETNVSAGLQPDATSPTGYAGGMRKLIVPGHNNESYQWIAQTQQMLGEHTWRLRHIDYDNAPLGRTVNSPSPYRWWLAGVAWLDHHLTGRPRGLAVEHAALWADPLLLGLFLVGGTILVAGRFGPWAASIFPLAAAMLFPWGGCFLPGAPDDTGLCLVLLGASLMTLLAGLLPAPAARARTSLWFGLSGFCGAVALWVNVSQTMPILIAVLLAAVAAGWLNRRDQAWIQPWRIWGLTGASTTLAFWLLEYAPDHLALNDWRLSEIHPLYALFWLGGGELPAWPRRWLQDGRDRRAITLLALAAALAALAAVPVAMWAKGVPGFLAKDAFAFRLTALGEGKEAANLATWIVDQHLSWTFLATLLPLTLLGIAGWDFIRTGKDAGSRAALLIASGVALLCFGFGCSQLSWWNALDLALLILVAVVLRDTAPGAAPRRALLALAVLAPGIMALWPAPVPSSREALSRGEKEALVERDFSHWLARRTGADASVVLAPPNLTTSLFFHGALHGLGSPYAENTDGFRASVRIAGATSADEAQALARQRKLTHIVIPSWDGFLDEYARLGADQPEHTLMGMINNWLHPRWLRAVPYYLPQMQGFEDDRLLVFEVTDVQDQATWLSRLTEYFLDMGQVELASIAAHTLETNFSADLGALVAKARTDLVRHDRTALRQDLDAIDKGLRDGSGESLPWDRRVSLCLVLAESGRTAPAREQAQRAFDEMGELDLRTLSEATLFRFLTLCRAEGFKFQDESLHQQARRLLPPQLGQQF